jgi:hypothetical protein
MLLSGIAGNFSSDEPEELEDAAVIQSDFAIIVAVAK